MSVHTMKSLVLLMQLQLRLEVYIYTAFSQTASALSCVPNCKSSLTQPQVLRYAVSFDSEPFLAF